MAGCLSKEDKKGQEKDNGTQVKSHCRKRCPVPRYPVSTISICILLISCSKIPCHKQFNTRNAYFWSFFFKLYIIVLVLPNIVFYDKSHLIFHFACGPLGISNFALKGCHPKVHTKHYFLPKYLFAV